MAEDLLNLLVGIVFLAAVSAFVAVLFIVPAIGAVVIVGLLVILLLAFCYVVGAIIRGG